MKQKVVVIGHGSTSRLGIVRALSEMDCEVTLVVMTWKDGHGRLDRSGAFDCHSKFIHRVLFAYYKDGENLINLLLEHCTDSHQKVVLLPDSDFSAAVIDDNKELLKDHFVFPHIVNDPDSLRYWMNKSNQKLVAAQVGLNHAHSNIIEIRNGNYSIPANIKYPCFTKPSVSIVGGKQFFRKCDSASELKELLDFVGSKGDDTILAEQYINIENEYALLGFSDGKEVVIPGIIRFIANSKSHFGIAMKGQIMPVTGFEPLLEQFKQLVLKIGFVGVFDIDFFWGDNKWWFGELNLRFGGSGYAVTKLGVNLPVMLVKYLTGERYADLPKKIEGIATYINERMCMDDWYRGLITTKEYRNILGSADISFVRDDNDPAPQRAFEKQFRRLQMKRNIKSLLGK